MQANWRRKARALIAVLLILSAALAATPTPASAGHGCRYVRHRTARHAYARVHRPRHRTRWHRAYAYEPYRVAYYRPRYRAVVVEDPYCYDEVYDVRPVYRSYRHRPRVGVSLIFRSGPGYYYGDPYCDW